MGNLIWNKEFQNLLSELQYFSLHLYAASAHCEVALNDTDSSGYLQKKYPTNQLGVVMLCGNGNTHRKSTGYGGKVGWID